MSASGDLGTMLLAPPPERVTLDRRGRGSKGFNSRTTFTNGAIFPSFGKNFPRAARGGDPYFRSKAHG
jgi:hypothetical protein